MRVGFIINGRIPEWNGLLRGMTPIHWLRGWDDSASPMSFMRFRWLAEELRPKKEIIYELYRPRRKYEAVVFVKSMGDHCLELVERLRSQGTRIIFDANVDYYTDDEGASQSFGFTVTPQQRKDAIAMTQTADRVMASSRHLAEVCSGYTNHPAVWIPDNVNFRMVPPLREVEPRKPLWLWWSGMPEKVVDILAIESVLHAMGKRVELHFVTRGIPRLRDADHQARFESLLNKVPHVFHEFHSIPQLHSLYQPPALIISPRFLDIPYNLGHSEWKITLGMACGLPALCSPVPSYCDVAERAHPDAIRIAHSSSDWEQAFEDAIARRWNVSKSSPAAREVVYSHYSTHVIAPLHAKVVAG